MAKNKPDRTNSTIRDFLMRTTQHWSRGNERYSWVHDMTTENPDDILRDDMQKSVELSLLGRTTRYEPKAIPRSWGGPHKARARPEPDLSLESLWTSMLGTHPVGPAGTMCNGIMVQHAGGKQRRPAEERLRGQRSEVVFSCGSERLIHY